MLKEREKGDGGGGLYTERWGGGGYRNDEFGSGEKENGSERTSAYVNEQSRWLV